MNTSLAPDPRTLTARLYEPFFEKTPDFDNVQEEVKHCSFYSTTIELFGGGDSKEKHWKEPAPYLPDMYTIGIRPKFRVVVFPHVGSSVMGPEMPPSQPPCQKEHLELDIWMKTIRFDTHPEFWQEDRIEKGGSAGLVSKYESQRTWKVDVDRLILTTQMQLAKWGFPMSRNEVSKLMLKGMYGTMRWFMELFRSRCYLVKRTNGRWFGCALDFGLTSEGETLMEADKNLMDFICSQEKMCRVRPSLLHSLEYHWIRLKDKWSGLPDTAKTWVLFETPAD